MTRAPGDAPERRRRPRFRLFCPVRLFRLGSGSRIDTKTEDISCEGFFCVTGSLLSPKEQLECELVIPIDSRNSDEVLILRCRAEVVRVERQKENLFFGVACRLADYRIERERSHRHHTFDRRAELA
jgi:hypothetical protein